MKEHNYMKHIGLGVKLDKLQEGDFKYDDRASEGTLSEFAKKVRNEVNGEDDVNDEVGSTSEISEASGNLQVNDIVRLKYSDIVGVVKEIFHDEEGKLSYNVLFENNTSEYEFYVEDDLEKIESISRYFHNLLNN